MSDGTRKPVRLPFDFGDIVYHKIKTERLPGMVTGFILRDNVTMILVTWSDNLCGESTHRLFELTTEFEPSYTTEP